ncbi:MAG: hypothetical protein NTV24_00740 [Candidatus Woesebacteria bacterium]|nr:hypothetical protein [Candidatus Woesebacteria bacterium]
MLTERETYKEGSLLTYVSSDEQKSVAIKFMHSSKNMLIDQTGMDYLTEIEDTISKPEVDSVTAVRAAIHYFDTYLSDEIRSYLPERSPRLTDAAAVYFRSDVYKQTYPQQVTEVLAGIVRSPIQDIVIASQEQIERFSPKSGFTGMLTPELAYWIGTAESPIVKPDPPCGVARQELYKSLIKCGINPLERLQLAIDSNSRQADVKVQPDSTYSSMFRRKGELSLHATEADLNRWGKNSSKHWGNILKENVEDTQDNSILFSSGTSSSEAVLLTLSKVCNGNAYIHPYWYYENMLTAQKSFCISDKVTRSTQIVLINLEPTNFFTFDKSAHIESPIQTINNLAQFCHENPGTNRYAVIDVTVDPLFQVREHLDNDLPPNLHIIKTLSVSKHQRGGRKYFFGVAYTTDEKLSQEITRKRALVGGNIYEPHIVHFPRPSSTWLAKQRETVSLLNSQLAKIHMDNNKVRWNLFSYTYHTFFFPKGEVLKSIQNLGSQNENIEGKVKNFNNEINKIVANVVKKINSPYIDLGDSFGLPQTRVCIQGGYNELNGVKFRLKLPRICPGYKTSLELVVKTTRNLLTELTASQEKIIATLR